MLEGINFIYYCYFSTEIITPRLTIRTTKNWKTEEKMGKVIVNKKQAFHLNCEDSFFSPWEEYFPRSKQLWNEKKTNSLHYFGRIMLTNSMVYVTQKFIAPLTSAESVQFLILTLISWRSILILFSHLCLGLPVGLLLNFSNTFTLSHSGLHALPTSIF